MAASSTNQKIAHHARSISLPSRFYPFPLAVKEQLNQLKASSEATISSASMRHNLSSLKDLYECVEELLQMQYTQQALSVDDSVLNGTLELLDICSTTRDVWSQMKQSAQDLQSAFCRRRNADLDMTNEIGAHMSSKKKISKVIRKCIGVGDMKIMNNKCLFLLLDKDQDSIPMISMVREVEVTTLAIFESLLSYLSGSNSGSKKSSWSMVSKLMCTKRVACERQAENTSQLKKVDSMLNTLTSHKQYKEEYVKNTQKSLEALEMSIQDLEDGLDCVFRYLIKTRVSLLNILTYRSQRLSPD